MKRTSTSSNNDFVFSQISSKRSRIAESLPPFILTLYKHQPHKMVKHTHTIRRQKVDELFECV